MSSQRQRQYLDAMGIDVWVRREMPVQADPHPSDREIPPGKVGAAEAAKHNVPSRIAAAAAPTGNRVSFAGEGGDSPGWDALATRVQSCTLCEELVANRTQTAFGVGDREADWLFIGEAPGAEEDRQGEPFVGRAGKLLDAMLGALGLERGRGVYIANILKCRPPNNRDPRPDESQNCRPFLDAQIALIRPKIIVALGRIAAQNLLGTDTPIGKLRGCSWEYGGIPLVVTYHPAYLLRSPTEKRRAWNDLLLARRVMGEACASSGPQP